MYERQLASAIPVGVQYRNFRAIRSSEVPEECDGVAGDIIPEPYQTKPTAEEALDAYRAAVKAEATAAAAEYQAKIVAESDPVAVEHPAVAPVATE